MQFTDIFIRRPVLATVISLIILCAGLMSYQHLNTRQYPKVQSSVITINTTYPGASASLMESFVTTPIENQVAGVDGIDYITSSNTQNSSTITVNFRLGYDINQAITDVNGAISSVRYLLPRDINDPVVKKEDPNANPSMFLSFSNDHGTPEEISDYLLRVIKPQFQTLPGVGQAIIFGDRKYAMRIWLNSQLMAAHHITANDIYQVLANNNIQAPVGQMRTTEQNLDIKAITDLGTAKAFNDLVVKNEDGQVIRMKDIGYAVLAAESNDVSVTINSKPQVVIGIIPKSDANPLDVSKEIYRVFPLMQQQFPKGMHGEIAWDSSIFIADSLKEVYKSIFDASLCVVLVIFLFLGSFRSVLIPMVTIPLSLIGACCLLHYLDYSINTFTLLAAVLAIGMVVDDAIVVLENIYRHIEQGMSPFDAAIAGAREIRFAIIAMTLTLAAVYAPIAFTTGLTGSLFREFACTLAGSVIISGIVALTLSPMMCSKIMRPHVHGSKLSLSDRIDRIFNLISNGYASLLQKALAFRSLIILLMVALFSFGGIVFNILNMNQQIVPTEDQGALLTMAFGPSAANLAFMQKYTQQLDKIYQSIPETRGYGIIIGFPIGINSAFSFLVLKPWDQRTRTTDQIKQQIFPLIWSIPGIIAAPNDPPNVPSVGGFFPINFVIKTMGSYEELSDATNKFLEKASQNRLLMNVRANLQMDKPEISLSLDRNIAEQLGVPISAITNNLNLLLGRPLIGHFVQNGYSYNVISESEPKFQLTPHDLDQLYVQTNTGHMTPLSNLITTQVKAAPTSLNHFQQMRATTITAIPMPGYSLGQALDYLQKVATDTLPSTMQIDYAGQSRQFIETKGAMGLTFIFALIFIFLVLSAQFESFRDPFIVLLSVPLSLVGALTAMMLTGCSMNIYTQIGLITLIGLISKHGILMVEFANQLLEEQHLTRAAAISKAATIRLRPILMTTGAMVLGAVPLAMAHGAGSAARHQIGWVIIGGMSVGTLFTLFVVPVVYTLLPDLSKYISQFLHRLLTALLFSKTWKNNSQPQNKI